MPKPRPARKPTPDPDAARYMAAWDAMVALWTSGHPNAWDAAYGALEAQEGARADAT